MRKVYQYTHQVKGKPRQEIVILSSKDNRDYDEILHRVALEICASAQGKKLCKGASGLSFGELMEIITPEMLAPYGVVMDRLRDSAEQMDNTPPVVNRCEMKLYREFCDECNRQLHDIIDNAEQIAKRLEALRLDGHPVISTWSPVIIPSKGISWAYQYATGMDGLDGMDRMERTFMAFLQQKIKEAKPYDDTKDAAYVKLGDCFINVNAKARDYEP